MTLPVSGEISASAINVELKRASTSLFDIGGAEERVLAEVPTGQIQLSDFHGKSDGEWVYTSNITTTGSYIDCGADANGNMVIITNAKHLITSSNNGGSWVHRLTMTRTPHRVHTQPNGKSVIVGDYGDNNLSSNNFVNWNTLPSFSATYNQAIGAWHEDDYFLGASDFGTNGGWYDCTSGTLTSWNLLKTVTGTSLRTPRGTAVGPFGHGLIIGQSEGTTHNAILVNRATTAITNITVNSVTTNLLTGCWLPSIGAFIVVDSNRYIYTVSTAGVASASVGRLPAYTRKIVKDPLSDDLWAATSSGLYTTTQHNYINWTKVVLPVGAGGENLLSLAVCGSTKLCTIVGVDAIYRYKID